MENLEENVKVNFPCAKINNHSKRTYWWNGVIAPCIFVLGTWKLLVSLKSRQLYPRENCPRYTFGRRLVRQQFWFGHGVEERNSQPLPEVEPLGGTAYVKILTGLYLKKLHQI